MKILRKTVKKNYVIIISSMSIKNINFINVYLLLSCIIYYFTIILL